MEKQNEKDNRDVNQGKGEAAEQSQQQGSTQKTGVQQKQEQGRAGNHQEGQYNKQDDDSTMRPSGNEETMGTP